mgnify:CR=1 FL=1
MRHVEQLLLIEPADPVVLLSFAELTLEGDADRAQLERVVALTAGIANETPVEAALLLYWGRALARLGLADAAIDVFTLALRRRKDRADTLLRQLRCERAVLYDQVGRKAQARGRHAPARLLRSRGGAGPVAGGSPAAPCCMGGRVHGSLRDAV